MFVKDGKIVFAIEEERLSPDKNMMEDPMQVLLRF